MSTDLPQHAWNPESQKRVIDMHCFKGLVLWQPIALPTTEEPNKNRVEPLYLILPTTQQSLKLQKF